MSYEQISNLIITGILPISLFVALVLISTIFTGTLITFYFIFIYTYIFNSTFFF